VKAETKVEEPPKVEEVKEIKVEEPKVEEVKEEKSKEKSGDKCKGRWGGKHWKGPFGGFPGMMPPPPGMMPPPPGMMPPPPGMMPPPPGMMPPPPGMMPPPMMPPAFGSPTGGCPFPNKEFWREKLDRMMTQKIESLMPCIINKVKLAL